jgi:hypothetical protein
MRGSLAQDERKLHDIPGAARPQGVLQITVDSSEMAEFHTIPRVFCK